MKRTSAVAAAALALVAGGAFAGSQVVSVACDRTNCVYAVGEQVTFEVSVRDAAGALVPTGSVTAVMDNFGPTVFASNRIDLAAGNPFTLRGRMSEPGFLRLSLLSPEIDNPTPYNPGVFIYSAVFSPECIAQRHPCPPDFDAFWADARAKLAREVPLDPQITPDPAHADDAEFAWYHVSFATFGRRVYGHMTVPRNAPPGTKFPARVQVPGAGFGAWANHASTCRGWITLFMSVFPWQLETDSEPNRPKYDAMNRDFFARGLAVGTEKDTTSYHVAGIAKSREDYFYYPVILGIDRAVDWLWNRDDVDRRFFTYDGTSQGGAFGLILMGLNRHFTRGVAYVPAMAGHFLHEQGFRDGWPRYAKAGLKNAEYFDGVFFAARITCPVRFSAGYSDTVCPPYGVHAAYNACKSSDKGIVDGLGMSHSVYGWIYQKLGAWEGEGWIEPKRAGD